MKKLNYILITPVRNEEAFIRNVIKLILSQTIKPIKWIIVDDGSTDQTGEIVKAFSNEYEFIRLSNDANDRLIGYSSRTNAVIFGAQLIKNLDYDYLGILDVDISFEPNYYEKILDEFSQNPKLGVAGGLVHDIENGKLDKTRAMNLEHVAGGVQMFRRKCYEEIEGFQVMRWGGDDVVAENIARMKGWIVQSFPDIEVQHHRQTGSRGLSVLMSRFRDGLKDYSLGYHPLFHLLKCFRRLFYKPIILGSFFRLMGFMCGSFKYRNRVISSALVEFIKQDQITKMKHKFLPFLVK